MQENKYVRTKKKEFECAILQRCVNIPLKVHLRCTMRLSPYYFIPLSEERYLKPLNPELSMYVSVTCIDWLPLTYV
jgi:hypothetical protein